MVPDFRLVIAGPIAPDGQDYLDRLAHEVEYAGIEIVGEVTREQKRHLMASAWCFLQPSLYEGFGVSVLEAMACGTVPVVSRAGALPEVVGTAGVLVEPNDAVALAGAVVKLLTDADGRTAMAIRARERSADYDRTRHVARWRWVLQDAGLV